MKCPFSCYFSSSRSSVHDLGSDLFTGDDHAGRKTSVCSLCLSPSLTAAVSHFARVKAANWNFPGGCQEVKKGSTYQKVIYLIQHQTFRYDPLSSFSILRHFLALLVQPRIHSSDRGTFLPSPELFVSQASCLPFFAPLSLHITSFATAMQCSGGGGGGRGEIRFSPEGGGKGLPALLLSFRVFGARASCKSPIGLRKKSSSVSHSLHPAASEQSSSSVNRSLCSGTACVFG